MFLTMSSTVSMRLSFNVQHFVFPKLYRLSYSTSTLAKNFYNEDHLELQETTKKLIEKEINPHTDEWEQITKRSSLI